MNFNTPLLKPLRAFLFPFSLLYGTAVWIRNRLYDRHILKSTSFELPLMVIGNLSAGGTGKSPMVEYMVRILKDRYPVAILSRGYRRKTKGYLLAGEGATARDIGDEPLQFYEKFPEVAVAVGEERVLAIPQLLQDRPATRAIILDDAFQHRAVSAGMNILLTEYQNLFTRDWFLPTGNLRDERAGYTRAQVIIVTKCPSGLPAAEKQAIRREIKPLPHQQLFFTSIRYGLPYHIITRQENPLQPGRQVLLLSGIANPAPLKQFLKNQETPFEELRYGDHHLFSPGDWQHIRKRLEAIAGAGKLVLTTEKDAVRLRKFAGELPGFPLYVIPIEVSFLFGEEASFRGLITKFIDGFGGQH